MTVSYPMSMKLHEKYPAMGSDSYWVWDEIWIEAAPGYQLITREKFEWKIAEFKELDGVVPTPALTLGEMVLWCGVNCFTSIGFRLDHTCWDAVIDDHKRSYYGKDFTIENALAQAIIEGGM